MDTAFAVLLFPSSGIPVAATEENEFVRSGCAVASQTKLTIAISNRFYFVDTASLSNFIKFTVDYLTDTVRAQMVVASIDSPREL